MNKNTIIQHNKPTLGEAEYLAAKRVIESQWVAQGNEVRQFEEDMCKFVGLPDGHAVAVANCTSAIFLVLSVLEVQNKTVAYPAYTCSAIRNAIHLSGGIECLIDSEIETPNIDIKALNQKKPQYAVIPHMYGLPVDISKISKKIIVIEDCAQAIGAKINGKHVGLQGKAGVFSFYASKLITSGGQGGMVISKDKGLIDTIKDYREFDQREDNKRRFNLQMTDLQAAIGSCQLSKINQFIRRRKEIFEKYQQAGFFMLSGRYDPVRYRAIMLSDGIIDKIKYMQEKNINVINPLETWELLEEKEKCPNAFAWTQKTMSLPIYPDLQNHQIEKIISEVKNL